MTNRASIDRIYILDGGLARVEDGSIYSPGHNVGVPMTLSCNAYLIRHRDQWLLWDTGTPDDLASAAGGKVIAHGIRAMIVRTLASQLAEIGVSPDAIATLALSHAHYDHVGNSRLFRKARWVVQRAEREAMFGSDPDAFGYTPKLYERMRENETRIVDGDCDLFGDGAVRMVFTPGHTLGHCSLLVRLPRTGPVLLSGDAAHNRDNLAHLRVPEFNAGREATVASMRRVAALAEEEGAAIWINHDTSQSATLPHAPAWIS